MIDAPSVGVANSPMRFGADGLIPVAIQAAADGSMLMVGFMNAEALTATRRTGLVHFWSRSRGTLWRKGETSGHVLRVREIRVNCETNSLLILVDPSGATCHDGYATCYYRRLDDDNSLAVVAEREFDPSDVYGQSAGTAAPSLSRLTRLRHAAYHTLASDVAAEVSRTARRLQSREDVSGRVADELEELAGAVDGSHRHVDQRADVRLEGGQVLYWLTVVAVGLDIRWDDWRPDRALMAHATADTSGGASGWSIMARGLATVWRQGMPSQDVIEHLTTTTAVIGAAARSVGVHPRDIIQDDLNELRSRDYLAAYFAVADHASSTDKPTKPADFVTFGG